MWFGGEGKPGEKAKGRDWSPGTNCREKRAKIRATNPITCCRVNNLIQKTKPKRSQSHRLFIINKMSDFATRIREIHRTPYRAGQGVELHEWAQARAGCQGGQRKSGVRRATMAARKSHGKQGREGSSRAARWLQLW